MPTLKDVMSKDVQIASPEDTVSQVAQQMREGKFGMMPVGENDRMIGAISDRDIAIRVVAEGRPLTTKVREIMSEGIIWAFEDDSIDEAARLMGAHQIRRLPVVNRDKRLVGILALGDYAVGSADIEAAGEALSNISKSS